MRIRMKIERYGLPSQRLVYPTHARRLLEQNGFVLTAQNSNCVYPHNSGESTKHWMIKSIVFKLLRDLGRTVGTEVETRGGIVDVLDANNLIAYEIETSTTAKLIKQKVRRLWRLHDIFIIDVRKVPDSLEEAVKCLREVIV